MTNALRSALAAVSLCAQPVGASTYPTSVITDYGPFSVHSDGGGQRSRASYAVPLRTTGELRVEYKAPAGHCSSVRMHFLLDGLEKGKSGAVAPGRTSGIIDMGPVVPGTHVLELQAEGVTGGCNVGVLSDWSGVATVWTSRLARDPASPIDTVAAGCGGGVAADGDEVSVSRDGTVEHRKYSVGRSPQTWRGSVPVPLAERLIARVNGAPLSSVGTSSIGEAACYLTLIDGTAQREILWSASGRDAPADAKAIFDEVRSVAAGAAAR